MRDAVQAPGAPQPTGPYSHAVRAGNLVFLSGQGPADPASGAVAEEFGEQVRQTLANLASVAEAAGSSLGDAVRVGVFLRDMRNFEVMNRVYVEFFGEPYPARTTVQSDLPIEIEIDAVVERRS